MHSEKIVVHMLRYSVYKFNLSCCLNGFVIGFVISLKEIIVELLWEIIYLAYWDKDISVLT